MNLKHDKCIGRVGNNKENRSFKTYNYKSVII